VSDLDRATVPTNECTIPIPRGVRTLTGEPHHWVHHTGPTGQAVTMCSLCGHIRWDAPVTLRDLIRAARAAGAPLRRVPGPTDPEYWECWDDGAHRRRALVRRWPDLYRVDMHGRHDDEDHAIRVTLVNPTLAEIAAAARLCGWDLATVDRGEAT